MAQPYDTIQKRFGQAISDGQKAMYRVLVVEMICHLRKNKLISHAKIGDTVHISVKRLGSKINSYPESKLATFIRHDEVKCRRVEFGRALTYVLCSLQMSRFVSNKRSEEAFVPAALGKHRKIAQAARPVGFQ